MKNDHFHFIVILSSFLMLLSCESTFEAHSTITYPYEMDLNNLEVGQRFHFMSILNYKYFTDTSDILKYEDNVLEVEIVRKFNDDLYLVAERIYYSTEFFDADNLEVYQDSATLYTKWDLRNDYLIITPQDDSREFCYGSYFCWENTFDLSPFSSNFEEVQMDNFHSDFLTYESDMKFYASDVEIRGFNYDTLNVKLNNESLSWGHVGNTLVYSEKHGIVRLIGYTYDFNYASGWERIRF